MQYATVALALATSAFAAPPSTIPAAPVLTPAPVCERFNVAFTAGNGSVFSANAVRNGTNGPIVLQGERLSAYPGTNAYFNTSNPAPNAFNYSSLNFIIGDSVYGAFAGDVGDDQGLSVPITLEQDVQQFSWSAYNGTISHQLYAAPNGFYACMDKLVGSDVSTYYLSFGDYNFTGSGSPPHGCVNSIVYQDFNVEGGLQQ